MALRDSGLSDSRPRLAWLTALALIVAVGIAVALVTLGRGSSSRLADSGLGAAGGVMATPIRAADHGADWISDYLFAGSQNADLRRRLVAAAAWRDQAVALREENARLRGLLGVRTDPPMPMVFAHTVLDARGPFSNSRLADAGAARGVIEGNPVLSDHGLVGRITGVAANVSRVMLLTDVRSRTPVLIVRSNGRAILTGDGGSNPTLAYLRTHDAPREGDRVLTSGDGGVLPRGLPVGSIVRGIDGSWRVALDSDAAPIDDVRILLFRDFSQLTPAAALLPSTLPALATGAPPAPPPEPVPAPTSVDPTARKPAAKPLAAKTAAVQP